jgi:hypothetical protein
MSVKNPLRINLYQQGTYAGCATLPVIEANAQVLASIAEQWSDMNERVQKSRDGYTTRTFPIAGTLVVNSRSWDEPRQFELTNATLDVTKHLSAISMRAPDWELHIYNLNQAKFEELAQRSTATC